MFFSDDVLTRQIIYISVKSFCLLLLLCLQDLSWHPVTLTAITSAAMSSGYIILHQHFALVCLDHLSHVTVRCKLSGFLPACCWGPAAPPAAAEAPGSAGKGSPHLQLRPCSDPGPAAPGPPSWSSPRPAHIQEPSASSAASTGPDTDPVWTENLQKDRFHLFTTYLVIVVVFGAGHSGRFGHSVWGDPGGLFL